MRRSRVRRDVEAAVPRRSPARSRAYPKINFDGRHDKKPVRLPISGKKLQRFRNSGAGRPLAGSVHCGDAHIPPGLCARAQSRDRRHRLRFNRRKIWHFLGFLGFGRLRDRNHSSGGRRHGVLRFVHDGARFRCPPRHRQTRQSYAADSDHSRDHNNCEGDGGARPIILGCGRRRASFREARDWPGRRSYRWDDGLSRNRCRRRRGRRWR